MTALWFNMMIFLSIETYEREHRNVKLLLFFFSNLNIGYDWTHEHKHKIIRLLLFSFKVLNFEYNQFVWSSLANPYVSMSVLLYFYARVCMFLCSKYFLCACPYISMTMPVCFYARTYSLLVSLYLYTCVSMLQKFLCSCLYVSMIVSIWFYALAYSRLVSVCFNAHVHLFLGSCVYIPMLEYILCSCHYVSMLV